MKEVQKNRIKEINIVFLVTVLIAVGVPFLPLDFLSKRPVLGVIVSQVLFALPVVVYMLVNRLSYAETVRFKKMKFTDMLLSILFGILVQPAITLINALSMVFSKNVTGTSILEIAERVPFLIGLLLVAVLPAIMEETVYRGVFYNEYSKINPLKAALLSGMMFGIMHGNINQFCYAAVLGIVFALLVEATGSILSTMLVHFWTNASSVVLLYIYPKLYDIAKAYYNMYKEYENETMAVMLENTFGDMTLPTKEWARQLMDSTANLQLTVPQVLSLYAPQALIMGVLAFFVYKKLAIRNNNWERICACFKEQSKMPETKNDVMTEIQASEEVPKKRMVTIPLVIALLLGTAFMIYYEILLQRNM